MSEPEEGMENYANIDFLLWNSWTIASEFMNFGQLWFSMQTLNNIGQFTDPKFPEGL